VLNGLEMASGSIRINRADLQTRVLDVIGIAPAEAEERFGFLLRALRFGAPPHGGIAPGIDRIAMQLGDTDNLREVVAFPKLGGGADPLTGAPAPLPSEQLAELGLTVSRRASSKPAAG
jgi:aspartyl-tRNA synthetase